ncbi:MAG: SDR family oxidoreductase, partial [Actinomycetota bacterium]
MTGRGRAVVTGASAGIGAATARALAKEGFEPVLGARRADRLRAIAEETGGVALALDVTDPASVAAFAGAAGPVRVLVNNAGGARGLEAIERADEEHWRWMWETNVLGLMRVTKAFLPSLQASGDGHVVNIGSTAALEAYAGGAGYTSTKHGVRAITQTLRQELLGKPVRVTEI